MHTNESTSAADRDSPMPGDKRRVILIAAALNSLDAHICTQLTYTDSRNNWTLIQRPFPWTDGLSLPPGTMLDGCLAWATHEREIAAVDGLKLPTVNMSGGQTNSNLPTVTNDNVEIGRLAARHLLHDCAMPHLAFVGISPTQFAWCRQRFEGFQEIASAAGLDCAVLMRPLRPGNVSSMPDQSLEHWVARLPKPVGIMGADDWCALAVMRACHHMRIAIPQDVAVIGANNDLICSMTTPTVSSVDRNQARVVLEATTRLEQLISGAHVDLTPTYIAPLGIVKRDSTNTLAVGNATIAAVIEYMRANVEEPFNIKTLARQFGISSRTLARGFVQWLHCRPTDYVLRVRLARAKELLREPHKLSVIAKVSGFSDEKQFRTAFKRALGVSPQEYRRQLMTNSSVTR